MGETIMTSDRKHTAYHEAGHAIAASELGVLFDAISIASDGLSAGSVGVEGDDGFWIPPGPAPDSEENERAYRAWAEEQAILDYAGHAAVVALLGLGDMSYRSARAAGAGHDFAKARRRLGARDRRRIAAAQARALEIVTQRGDDIRKVAEALLEHEALSNQQIDNVIYWDTPSGPFGENDG